VLCLHSVLEICPIAGFITMVLNVRTNC